MKKSVVLGILLGLMLGLVSQISAQEKQGTCFKPEDKEEDVCVDFANSWFYVEKRHNNLYLVYVRHVGTRAENHIWNGGQYLVSEEEFKKVESGLSSLGFGLSCPPPDTRRIQDFIKKRSEICKK